MCEVIKTSEEFKYLARYVLEHAPMMANHRAFGEMVRDILSEIESLEKSINELRRQIDGIHCQYCGDLLSNHIVSERGGHCIKPGNTTQPTIATGNENDWTAQEYRGVKCDT